MQIFKTVYQLTFKNYARITPEKGRIIIKHIIRLNCLDFIKGRGVVTWGMTAGVSSVWILEFWSLGFV
jgi:hypothetical protein